MRVQRIWLLVAAASVAATVLGCTESPESDGSDDPDASRVGAPDDAASDPDATPGSDAATADAAVTDAAVVEPDANTRCVLPLTVDLDEDGYASFLYDHPDCSGESGIADGAALAFEDSIDADKFFSANEYGDVWEIQAIEYPDNECIVEEEEGTLLCTEADAGDLIPVQLIDGINQLDVEFRLDHEGQTVTVESAIYSLN